MENSLRNLLFFLLLFSVAMSDSVTEDRAAYIIHMDKAVMPAHFSGHHDWYLSMLSSLTLEDAQSPTHLYTYNHVLDGFSAVLSRSQVDQLEKMPGHVATRRETFGKLHTTYTPKFLGLKKNEGLWHEGKLGDDMIIGIIDTGIWPESKSFKDDGMPRVPDRWRGACESGVLFNSSNCNRKLIGARSFSKGMKQMHQNISTTDDYDSPRDYFGHGTHTSSTAAGSPVEDAEYFGYAKGTAIGIAPKARLAMYKVLFLNDTYDSAATDTLAGIDQAIEDGVDLMSLSLGFIETPFDENPIAVGAFAAMEKGIFVSCSAGNNGPHGFTILNGAPWITTVGASTIDRDYVATVSLNNGDITVQGRSIYPLDLEVNEFPVYFGYGNRSKELCDDYSLDPKDVEGKFVLCDYIDENSGVNPYEVSRAGDPNKALDPGLVYDLEVQDYINYLCGMNYTSAQIQTITRRSNYSCEHASLDLNYPSFMVLINGTNSTSYTFHRVLTNVVNSPSVYHAVIMAPSGMKVNLEPPVISFTGLNSKAMFKMTVEVHVGDLSPTSDAIINYGYLSWNEVNGSHMVRSPIVSAYAIHGGD
ncbi:Subtilisin-like protease, fibronectin type-III domain [Dillenia turbinata]|uniref:Subtilisin-like protease, fibronectin type-III domain n=1 Tax=Dillenia turbinata TaxID=194707 RepID=A0AAN8Z0N2_9MAGN